MYRSPTCLVPAACSRPVAISKFDCKSKCPLNFSHARMSTRASYITPSSNPGFAPPKETGSVKKLAEKEMVQVCDKLIKAFQSKPQMDWRKLIAFSSQWPNLAEKVFSRIEELINTEDDPERKLKLRRFRRGLKNAHEDVAKFSDFFSKFEDASEDEYEAIVAGHEDILASPGFFDYLGHIATAAAGDKERAQEIVATGQRIAAIHEAYARAEVDNAKLAFAQEKLQSILQVDTLEEAGKRIDSLAAEGQVDPAFLLTMAKAYSGVKETDMAKDEVKDIMYYLYQKAREATERDAPNEVRILKHLVMLESERDRLDALDSAFKPGAQLSTDKEDFVHTDPKMLLATVDVVLKAYQEQRGKTSLLGQTAELMQPAVIDRMRHIRSTILRSYL